MTIDQDILSDIGLVACGSVVDERMVDPDECDEIYDELYGPVFGTPICSCRFELVNNITQRHICPACRACTDPDEQPGGDPWPDGPCRNCAGPHHIQVCPEILAALRAPYPNGAEIARAFHRNYRGWAREEMQKGFPVVYNDARLYADYMAERLPNQEPMTVLRVIRIWDRAASAHQGERCV